MSRGSQRHISMLARIAALRRAQRRAEGERGGADAAAGLPFRAPEGAGLLFGAGFGIEVGAERGHPRLAVPHALREATSKLVRSVAVALLRRVEVGKPRGGIGRRGAFPPSAAPGSARLGFAKMSGETRDGRTRDPVACSSIGHDRRGDCGLGCRRSASGARPAPSSRGSANADRSRPSSRARSSCDSADRPASVRPSSPTHIGA